jgi:hypothetical protein
MIAPFDVFKIDRDGHVLWCDQATSLEESCRHAAVRFR